MDLSAAWRESSEIQANPVPSLYCSLQTKSIKGFGSRQMATHSSVLGLPWWLSCKESACNVGDLGLILGWEDPLEKGKATHSSILAWRIPRGHKESDTTERLSLASYQGSQIPCGSDGSRTVMPSPATWM